MNPKSEPDFLRSGMRISATDEKGIAKIIEWVNRPFFMGTLWVPQVASACENPHPVIFAFLSATV